MSTTMPSGIRLPSLTMTFTSEPSGFAEKIWPLLALRKNKRPAVPFGVGLATFDLDALRDINLFSPFVVLAFLHAVCGYLSQNRPFLLNESAQAGNGLAQNQVLHLERTLVGVQSFRIHEESPDVVVSGDAVAAEQLARPRDRLAALGCREGFGKGGMRVRHLAFGLQLGHAHQEALRSGDVGEHLSEEILHHLE